MESGGNRENSGERFFTKISIQSHGSDTTRLQIFVQLGLSLDNWGNAPYATFTLTMPPSRCPCPAETMQPRNIQDSKSSHPGYSENLVSSDNTISQQSLTVAQRWLDKYLDSHGTCSGTTSLEHWYPTRPLYIQKLDDTAFNVRLIHTARERPEGPCFTLSHRRGGADFIKLTKQTMAAFDQNIPTHDLPKTLVDAITVSLRLRAHYLWIDSLCIIQD
jgi:hypothetical protein